MRVFIILALLSLMACGRGATLVSPHAPTVLSPQTRTVLTGPQALALAHPCSRAAPGQVSGQWTPSSDDLEPLEKLLQSVLTGQLVMVGPTAAPADYYRQFAGFIVNGRRVIYVSGVSRRGVGEEARGANPIDWRTQALSICDGGPISFGAEYDADTHQLSKFSFNGAP